MRLCFLTSTAATLILATTTSYRIQPSATDSTITIQAIASPADAESAQPQLSVSARGVLLSWIERTAPRATLRFAERTASGWSAPRTAASGTDWFVNWADVPSVLRLADGTLAAHWLQRSGGDTYAYDVRLSFSKDNGQTWSPGVTPHHDGTKSEHGFASLFQMPGAGLGLIWLDGRAMATMKGGHDGHGSGDMSVRFASFDRNSTQTAELPVSMRVCECCPTSTAVTADGPVAVFRNRTADEIRDIYISRLEKGKWSEPAPVHAEGWRMPACPVNGPVVSARGRDVVVAWYTAKNDQPRTYLAFSSDVGRSFGAPVRLDDLGTLGRVDVELLPDGSAVASYIEYANQRAEFRFRRIERSGAKSSPMTVTAIASTRSSGYPRMAVHGDELIFAWIAPDSPGGVRTALARLPAASARRGPRE
jgi:hypothetical protein